jgi:hypothetical protein
VGFIKPTELHSLELLDRVHKGAESTYIEVRNSKNECQAPVFTVEQTNGTTANFAIMYPGVVVYDEYGPTTFDFAEIAKNLPPNGEYRHVFNPSPKLAYVCRLYAVVPFIGVPQVPQPSPNQNKNN